LPLHGKRNENPFCALMAQRSRSCGACLALQQKLAQAALTEPTLVTCAYGLSEIAVPVKLGKETIALLQTGQVMQQKPTESMFRCALKRAENKDVDLDYGQAKEAYLQTPVVSKKKLNSVTKLLAIFAEHLAIKNNEATTWRSTAESPIVTRAREYIEANHAEELSLRQVAQAVHVSAFYLCKLFKKATGINFTEFVSRIRLEKAKQLLLNQNLRVSEIAYEVGFQSLTHFNRTFKKVMGQSPTEYRAQFS
jgi:YesN/AraC family two-component response regulator